MGDYGQYIVPGVDTQVNFKVGQPAPSMLPLDKIRHAAMHKLAQQDPTFLQYGHIYGFKKFRVALAEFLTRRYGSPVDPELLMASNGNTGALSMICSLFTQAGDLVFAEEPTYFLAKQIFKDFKLNCKQIPMDEHGLDVDALEEALKAGPVPKMMYVVTTCHNPTGRTLIAERREKLAQLSADYNFLLVCDEVYQLLSFPHVTVPPPMYTYDKGTVLGLGSFSKILAPALRVGWIQGSAPLLKKIASCGQLDSSGGLNPVAFGIVQSAIELGIQDAHLDWTRQTLSDRCAVLEKACEDSLPKGVTYEKPQGGYFILVKLPEGQNSQELLHLACPAMKPDGAQEGDEDFRVCFLPGISFSESMANCLRLSFSYYDAEELKIGVQRLGHAIEAYWKKIGFSN